MSIRFEDGFLTSPDDALDIPIVQLQLEQDTGKTTHAATDDASQVCLIDYNRAGVALVEIVSAPVLRTPEQAGAYVRKLRQLLRCVGASDGNMNEGSLRCDANVSIHRTGEPFGPRTEIKNLNSIKFMMHALDFEIRRQYTEVSQGRAVEPSTRGFHEATGETYLLRRKEDALDYRFMPEPNVGALHVSPAQLAALAETLPELPDARHARLRAQYGLSVRDVNVLLRLNADDDGDARTAQMDAVDYFEELVRLECAPQAAANWTIHILPKFLGQMRLAFHHNPVPPTALAELIHMLDEEIITQSTAQALLRTFVREKKVPMRNGCLAIREHVHEHNLHRMHDDELRPLCQEVVRAFPAEVEAIQKGKHKVLARLVGESMRHTQGRADPAHITRLLTDMTCASIGK